LGNGKRKTEKVTIAEHFEILTTTYVLSNFLVHVHVQVQVT